MTKLIREILSGSSLCTALMCALTKTHTYSYTHMDTHIEEELVWNIGLTEKLLYLL